MLLKNYCCGLYSYSYFPLPLTLQQIPIIKQETNPEKKIRKIAEELHLNVWTVEDQGKDGSRCFFKVFFLFVEH